MTVPKQEKRFEYKGFPCVVLFMPIGYRCGYVGLPIGTVIDTDEIDCHGGITYSKNHLYHQEDKDRFWIGFDCGHCYDGYDVETAKKLYADDKNVMKQIKRMSATGYFTICNEENSIRTLEYCEEQCKSIAEQLIERGLNLPDYMAEETEKYLR